VSRCNDANELFCDGFTWKQVKTLTREVDPFHMNRNRLAALMESIFRASWLGIAFDAVARGIVTINIYFLN
jgi:hypothetical protein